MRFSTLLPVAALAALAAAAPRELVARDNGECTTGPIQCCETTYQPTSKEATTLLGLLGIVLDDVVGLVGVGCSSAGVTVGGGSSCTQEPVCCNDNNFSGLIAIGCSPITITL